MGRKRRRQISNRSFLRSTQFFFIFQSFHSNSFWFGAIERWKMSCDVGNIHGITTRIYSFPFTGLWHFPLGFLLVQFAVGLYLNFIQIGMGLVDEGNAVAYQYSPLTLQSTLNFEIRSLSLCTVDLAVGGEYLIDNDAHYTHFTGFVLQEDIVASLWYFLLIIRKAPNNIWIEKYMGQWWKTGKLIWFEFIRGLGISWQKFCFK